MDTYYIELDGIDYDTTEYYTALSYRQLLNWVILDLEECGVMQTFTIKTGNLLTKQKSKVQYLKTMQGFCKRRSSWQPLFFEMKLAKGNSFRRNL